MVGEKTRSSAVLGRRWGRGVHLFVSITCVSSAASRCMRLGLTTTVTRTMCVRACRAGVGEYVLPDIKSPVTGSFANSTGGTMMDTVVKHAASVPVRVPPCLSAAVPQCNACPLARTHAYV